MYRWLGLLIAHAACGRIGFDAPSDAIVAGDSPGLTATPVMVHWAAGSSSSSSVTVTMPPTAAGHFLAVGVVSYNTVQVASIGDNAGNTYVSANARAIISAGGATEIWYVRNSRASVTQVVITITGSGLEGWVAELSGIDGTPIEARIANDQNAGLTVIAPTVTTTSPNALVVSVAAIVSGATGVHAGSPFMSLGIPNGDIAGSYIAPAPGSYGAIFDATSSGLACSSTAAFPAALL